MNDAEAPRRGSFGSSLLVAFGWYATLLAAIFVGRAGVPTNPNRDCSAAFDCLKPQEEFLLAAIIGAPVLAAMLLTTLAITAPLARRAPSRFSPAPWRRRSPPGSPCWPAGSGRPPGEARRARRALLRLALRRAVPVRRRLVRRVSSPYVPTHTAARAFGATTETLLTTALLLNLALPIAGALLARLARDAYWTRHFAWSPAGVVLIFLVVALAGSLATGPLFSWTPPVGLGAG